MLPLLKLDAIFSNNGEELLVSDFRSLKLTLSAPLLASAPALTLILASLALSVTKTNSESSLSKNSSTSIFHYKYERYFFQSSSIFSSGIVFSLDFLTNSSLILVRFCLRYFLHSPSI